MDETGPFTIEQLKTTSIQRDTLVWRAGFHRWTAAGDIRELDQMFQKAAEPQWHTKVKLHRIWSRQLFKLKNKKIS